jgi:hypothetical protein
MTFGSPGETLRERSETIGAGPGAMPVEEVAQLALCFKRVVISEWYPP